jgi:hypothetical protein
MDAHDRHLAPPVMQLAGVTARDGAARALHAIATAVLFAAITASASHAQVLRGTVMERGSGQPVALAAVSALDSSGAVVQRIAADTDGRFRLQLAQPGRYRLHVERIGYRAFVTDVFTIGRGAEAAIDVQMQVDAIVSDALPVVAERRVAQLEQAGFYHRRELGIGRFLERDEIEKRDAPRLTELLRVVPGVRIARVGDGRYDVILRSGVSMFVRGRPEQNICYPTIAVDRVIVRRGGAGVEVASWNDVAHPNDIEAVEVFASSNGAPPWLSGSHSPCGAIVFWTRK